MFLRMVIPKFDRLVARYFVAGVLGQGTPGATETLVDHAEDDPLCKIVLLVVEHARLSGATLPEIRHALLAWFSDPDLRVWWMPEHSGPLISSVDFDPLGGAVWVTFEKCFVSESVVEEAMHCDPEWHGGEEAWLASTAATMLNK